MPAALAVLAVAVTGCEAGGTPVPPTRSVTSAVHAPTASTPATTSAPVASLPPAMTRGDLFARNGPAAMKESAAPPYRIGALDRVFTGELRETARFKSVFYRTKGYREEGEHTISGRGPIFALPKSRGRNAALVLLSYRSGAKGAGGPQKDLMLLVQDAGKSTWRLASMTEIPYLDQLPTPTATPSVPTRAQERAARAFVGTVVRYLERGTIPRGPKLGVAPYEWRQRIQRARIGGDYTVDVELMDTGVTGVGPGAPITVIPVQGGIVGVAQLVATVTADSGWAPGGEGDTNDVYQQALGGDRTRTRDGLAITFVVPDAGEPAVIGGDLGLMLPQ